VLGFAGAFDTTREMIERDLQQAAHRGWVTLSMVQGDACVEMAVHAHR
jgi:hypothetical protein